MLRAVGEPRRIERAIKRLQGALKGIPSRSVRLTWRGGELRTTIYWARDDAYWWAVEPRPARGRLISQVMLSRLVGASGAWPSSSASRAGRGSNAHQ